MKRSSNVLHFRINGAEIVGIYSDAIVPLLDLGDVQIMRASHVEPAPAGGWTADLSPVGGPILGPFPLRADALAEEVRWINAHLEGVAHHAGH